jgi:hypothetical protein
MACLFWTLTKILLTNMSQTFLTFTSQATAQTMLNKINKNYPIIGTNAETGEPEPTEQKTEIWANLTKAYNLDLWYFEKPSQEFMTGVSGYVEQEYDPSWQEPFQPNQF